LGLFQVRLERRFFLILGLVVITLATGMATGFELFYRLLYILALTILIGFLWSWVDIRALKVTVDRRILQARVGDSINESFSATNHSISPKNLLEIEDKSDLPGYFGMTTVNIKPKGHISWDMTFIARKRGLYHIGPVRVSVSDPFTIFSRERYFGDTDELIIFPMIHNIQDFAVPISELSGDGSTRKRTHSVTPQASNIRDYEYGDSLSRVHWKSTARLGKLMSKVFDLGRASEAWIMVDLERNVQSGEMEQSTDEYAVSIAASLSKQYLDLGMPTGLIAYGSERYFLGAETGKAHFDRIMQQLALSDSKGEIPLHTALAREEPIWDHQSSLVVITPSPCENWVTALRELSRQGVKVIVIVIDNQSFGGELNSLEVLAPLNMIGIPTYVVKKDDDFSVSLRSGSTEVDDIVRDSIHSDTTI